MMKFDQKNKQLQITVNTDEMNPQQVRLIKSLMAKLQHLLTTDDETEFFEMSNETFRACAAIVKQSNFSELHREKAINFADQAIEYSVDHLSDDIHGTKLYTFDN